MSALSSISPSPIAVIASGGNGYGRVASADDAQATDPATARTELPGTNASSEASPGREPEEASRRDRTPATSSSDAAQQQQDQQILRELSARDLEVRQHEMAHQAAGGGHTGAVSYSYQRGPDGRMYAVGGEVSIDTSAVSDSPQATLEKADAIVRAAMAPAEPSSQDYRVAASARAMASEARAELAKLEESEPADDEGDAEEVGAVDESAAADEPNTTGVTQAAAGNSSAESDSRGREALEQGGLNVVQQQLINSGAYSRMYPPGSLFSLQA